MAKIIGVGAEAVLTKIGTDKISKIRPVKKYRLPQMDLQLRKIRTRSEAKILQTLHDNKMSVPRVFKKDDINMIINMEFIDGKKLRDTFNSKNVASLSKQLGTILAQMHNLNIIHSDLTTSNMLLKDKKIYLIDFGLSYFSQRTEDKAVDLHLLKQALDSYHYDIAKRAFKAIMAAYKKTIADKDVITRLELVEKRGKNKKH